MSCTGSHARIWSLVALTSLACILGALTVFLDVFFKAIIPSKKRLKLPDRCTLHSLILCFSSGIVLYLAFVICLQPSAKNIQDSGISTKFVSWITLVSFFSGIVAIHFFSFIIHLVVHDPYSLHSCDHLSSQHTVNDSGDHLSQTKGKTILSPTLEFSEVNSTSYSNPCCHSVLNSAYNSCGKNRQNSGCQSLNSCDQIAKSSLHVENEHGKPANISSAVSAPVFFELGTSPRTTSSFDFSQTTFPPDNRKVKHVGTAIPPTNIDETVSLLHYTPEDIHENSLYCSTSKCLHIQNNVTSTCGTKCNSSVNMINPDNESSIIADPLINSIAHVPCHSDCYTSKEQKPFFYLSLQTSIAIICHKLPEGFIMYATNCINVDLGTSVFAALMIHCFIEGIILSLPIHLAGKSRLSAVFWSLILGSLSQPLGAAIAAIWLSFGGNSSQTSQYLLYGCIEAISAGIMVYVALGMLAQGLARSPRTNLCLCFVYFGMCIIGISHAIVVD